MDNEAAPRAGLERGGKTQKGAQCEDADEDEDSLLSEVIRESDAGDVAPRPISSREGGTRVSVEEEAAIAELEQAAAGQAAADGHGGGAQPSSSSSSSDSSGSDDDDEQGEGGSTGSDAERDWEAMRQEAMHQERLYQERERREQLDAQYAASLQSTTRLNDAMPPYC